MHQLNTKSQKITKLRKKGKENARSEKMAESCTSIEKCFMQRQTRVVTEQTTCTF